jgi:hypothetical protein
MHVATAREIFIVGEVFMEHVVIITEVMKRNIAMMRFETAIESVVSYGWEICTLDCGLKKKLLSTGMELRRKQ